MSDLTIWANPFLTQTAEEYLIDAIGSHRLVLGGETKHVLDPGVADTGAQEAEIVFGQPDPAQFFNQRNCAGFISRARVTRPMTRPLFATG